MIGDFHVHSSYSYDSLMRPKRILELAKKRGIDVVAFTDHGTIAGGMKAKLFEAQTGVRVIVGAEVSTDVGDIIGLHLKSELRASNWREVLAEIRSQGGLVVLPHPYRGHANVNEVAAEVDLIEVWNARCSRDDNRRAAALAVAAGKGMTAGSDAHLYSEIGLAQMEMDDHSWTTRRVVRSGQSSLVAIRFSQVLGHLRRRGVLGLAWVTITSLKRRFARHSA